MGIENREEICNVRDRDRDGVILRWRPRLLESDSAKKTEKAAAYCVNISPNRAVCVYITYFVLYDVSIKRCFRIIVARCKRKI